MKRMSEDAGETGRMIGLYVDCAASQLCHAVQSIPFPAGGCLRCLG